MASQQPIELILLRQLASHLKVPIWMMDESGNLLYYNEAAERALGATFDEVGPIHAEELVEVFQTASLDESGEELPVVRALTDRSPANGRIHFKGMDGVERDVEITAIPIEGQAERFLGVFAVFWEIPS